MAPGNSAAHGRWYCRDCFGIGLHCWTRRRFPGARGGHREGAAPNVLGHASRRWRDHLSSGREATDRSCRGSRQHDPADERQSHRYRVWIVITSFLHASYGESVDVRNKHGVAQSKSRPQSIGHLKGTTSKFGEVSYAAWTSNASRLTAVVFSNARSEERRVGKECRS